MAKPGLPAGRKSELRSSERFPVDDAVPLVYRKTLLSALGIGRSNQARAVVNLSAGGLLIRTRDRVQHGTAVKVRLHLEKFGDVIEAEGVVRWCSQAAGEGADYYAGIRFTRVPDPAAMKISRLRGYFTSAEYRTRSAARRRRDPLGLEIPA
jgi:Tfp pilus assembly protein PilZ